MTAYERTGIWLLAVVLALMISWLAHADWVIIAALAVSAVVLWRKLD